MKQNISIVDRYARLVTGILALNYASSSSKRQVGRGLMLSVGAMKVAEGITGWCPATQLYETFFNSRGQKAESQQAQAKGHHKDDQQRIQHQNQDSHHSQSHHKDSHSSEVFEIQ